MQLWPGFDIAHLLTRCILFINKSSYARSEFSAHFASIMFQHTMTPAEAVAEKAKHASCGRATRVVLSACTALYSVVHLGLFILSAVAWRQADHTTKLDDECLAQPQLCNPTRGALHAFIMMASLVCFLTTGLMATRLIFHRQSSPTDSVWIFRGILFTLVLLVPLLFVGWSTAEQSRLPSVVINNYGDFLDVSSLLPRQETGNNSPIWDPAPPVDYDGSLPDLSFGPRFPGGIAGAFVIESVIAGYDVVKTSIVMLHADMYVYTWLTRAELMFPFSVIGAIVAGLALALAPIAQGVSVAC